jgi:hypothetical protein
MEEKNITTKNNTLHCWRVKRQTTKLNVKSRSSLASNIFSQHPKPEQHVSKYYKEFYFALF